MGRSKFPGKPSKHIQKKRVNVILPTTDSTNSDQYITSIFIEEPHINKQSGETNTTSCEDLSTSREEFPQKLSKIIHSKLRRKAATKNLICVKSTNGLKTKISTHKAARQQISKKLRSHRTYTVYNNNNNKQLKKTNYEHNSRMGKFVLPSKSMHSSRVIKPNKRFINVDLNESILINKKVLAKKRVKEIGMNKVVKKLNDRKPPHQVSFCENKTFTNNNRIVLRQARLKLHSQTTLEHEGPFSSNSHMGSQPGTVTCGVCGAVRFYRFVKQARKFNIYSCESCRKFISKMIKRQTCSKENSTPLVCHKGQGMCHVPPIVRSQQWKLIRCAYRARCPACWLKMCLRSFQMPASLKYSLAQLLPNNMQDSFTICKSLPLLWKFNENTTHFRKRIDSAICNKNKDAPSTTITTFKNPTPSVSAANNNNSRRQKIELKGPRVKHVCRSASAVLGQYPATFPAAIERCESVVETEVLTTDVVECSSIKKVDDNNFSVNNLSNSNENIVPFFENDDCHTDLLSQSDTNSDTPSEDLSSDLKNIISMNFWLNNEPQEVNENGFSIVMSEKCSLTSICYLCGSAGSDIMLYCTLCCEPYHHYCLEEVPFLDRTNSKDYVWICPKCTLCNNCNKTEQQKIYCQKCCKAYHPECFSNEALNDSSKNLVCSKCLICKVCESPNVSKYLGNQLFCEICFKLQSKHNYCPLCMKNYESCESTEKIIECNRCKKWLHFKCEKLTEEQYYMLGILPDNVEYSCSLCSTNSQSNWQKALEYKIKTNLNKLVTQFNKNKVVKRNLKLNIHKRELYKKITAGEKIKESNKNSSVIEEIISNIDEICTERLHDSFIFNIKNKINNNHFKTVKQFKLQFELAFKTNVDVYNVYQSIFYKIFPWYREIEDLNYESEINSFDNSDSNKMLDIEFISTDIRHCALCNKAGDGLCDKESRLLYCSNNVWIHVNCAIWSSEVFEDTEGFLHNINRTVRNASLTDCIYCKKKGASIGCCIKNCCVFYHFVCAQTANCIFLEGQLIICPCHGSSENVSSKCTDFSVKRSVFIEIDKNTKSHIEIDKINIMIGSLCVTNLGKIYPKYSDTNEVIIPIGFVCSRMFWSTIEPWKLVPYKICTSLLGSEENHMYIEKNFTVDHTLPQLYCEKKINEINSWLKEIDKKTKSDLLDFDEEDEEPQNGVDLLSPELTDAILKEIPGDLLDGICVQDIFPRFMTYDDLVNMDLKNDDTLKGFKKKNEIEPKPILESAKKKDKPQNKSSKLQQRSCSVILSCTLDRSESPIAKKRKVVSRNNNISFQLLQVDGNFDDSSSDVDSQIQEYHNWEENPEKPVTCKRCFCTYRNYLSYNRHLESCELITSDSDTDDDINHVVTTSSSSEILQTENYNLNNQNTELKPEELNLSYVNSVIDEKNIIMSDNIISEVPSDVTIQSSNNELNKNVMPPQQYYNIMQPQTVVSINETQTNNQKLPLYVSNNQPLYLDSSFNVQPTNTSISLITPALNTLVNQVAVHHSTSQSLAQQNPQLMVSELPTLSIEPLHYNLSNSLNTLNYVPQQNQILLNGKIVSNNNIMNPVLAQSPENSWLKQNSIKTSAPLIIRNNNNTFPKCTAINQNGSYIIQEDKQNPFIVQHVPNNFMPTLIDNYPQQNCLSYIGAVPQVNSMQTQPIIQVQQNEPTVSLIPTVLPQTVLNQSQMILDNNPTQTWTTSPTVQSVQPIQPVQPLYYGYETIVQNTVMSSQQLLHTAVPGVLTANSSYSTTTQVFQTSTIEPMIDVPSNTYILVSSDQFVNPQPSETQQYSQPQQNITRKLQQEETTCKQIKQKFVKTNNASSSNNIKLPTSPIVIEQGIPTNVVTPILKKQNRVTNDNRIKQTRPMSRVLPMQSTVKNLKKDIIAIDNNAKFMELKKLEAIKKMEPIKKAEPLKKIEPVKKFEPLKKFEKVLKYETVKMFEPVKLEPVKNFEPVQNFDAAFKKFEPVKKFEPIKKLQPVNKKFELINNKYEPITKKLEPSKKLEPVKKFEPIKKLVTVETTLTPNNRQVEPVILNGFIKNFEPKPLSSRPVLEKGNQPKKMIDLSWPVIPDRLCEVNPPKPEVHFVSNTNESSLKMVFQKQSQDNNSYKISNSTSICNNINKNTPVQVVPLKPIKSNNNNVKVNIEKEKKESTVLVPKCQKRKSSEKKHSDSMSSIIYTIETQDGFQYSSTSIYDLWSKVMETVQNARAEHNMPLLPSNSKTQDNNSLHILGLNNKVLKYLIEQLPGASDCSKYKPKFYFPASKLDCDKENLGYSSGAIRCVPYIKNDDPHDMFGWLASRHRKPQYNVADIDLLPRRLSATNLPMAMRFRQLKLTSKYSVGVYRSKIHRRGLFCLRDIEQGEMVIEYSGEVIRSVLSDKREKYYNSKGIGCYMFRVDDNLVVDATMKGNAARFINHSCEPNCYSKVIEFFGHKHIVIFALRKILYGEELTYDYKFPFEEDKIPCTCGSRRCRKFLN